MNGIIEREPMNKKKTRSLLGKQVAGTPLQENEIISEHDLLEAFI